MGVEPEDLVVSCNIEYSTSYFTLLLITYVSSQLLDEFAPEDAVDLPIDLTSGDIIPASNRATLESINDTVVNHVNFTSFEQLIGGSILSFGLDQLHSNLTLLANITEQVHIYPTAFVAYGTELYACFSTLSNQPGREALTSL